MLTGDLVSVRKRGELIVPAYLTADQARQNLPLLEALLDAFRQAPGQTVSELDSILKELTEVAKDRPRIAAFIKLLKDRCEVDEPSSAESEKVRAILFRRAAAQRRALDVAQRFERESVLQDSCEELGLSTEQIEHVIFGDLPGEQAIRSFREVSAQALVQRYNLALAQGVLLRATRVVVDLEPSSAPRLRAIFRALKFRRLMHETSGDIGKGLRLTVDGPMSLFEATQRYGLQLALFLPALVAGDGWKLRAEVLWGKSRARCRFELSDEQGLSSTHSDTGTVLEEVAALEQAFGRLGGPWHARKETRVFDIKGKAVVVPDLVFEHEDTGQRVYLEAFGYWSRETVFRRVELLQQGFSQPMILAVSRKLRVSPEIADESLPARILVYSQSIPAHAVKRMLDELAGAPESPQGSLW